MQEKVEEETSVRSIGYDPIVQLAIVINRAMVKTTISFF